MSEQVVSLGISGKSKPGTLLVLLLIMVLVGRIGLASGPLWLDEIWSVLQVARFDSLSSTLLEFRHDNNHLLQSLWIFAIGVDADPLAMRIPSLFGSLIFLACAYVLSSRMGSVFCGVVLAIHPVFVLLGVEARGYSLMLALTLLAYLLQDLRRELTYSHWILFLGVAIVATLSHASAAPVLAGFLCTALYRNGRLQKRAIVSALLYTVFLLLLYFSWFRWIEIGGGPQQSFTQFLFELSSIFLVGPEPRSVSGPVLLWAIASSLLAFALVLRAFRVLWQRDLRDFFVILLSAVVLPALTLLFVGTGVLTPRYFSGSLMLLLVAVCRSIKLEPDRKFFMLFVLAFSVQAMLHYPRFLHAAPSTAISFYSKLCELDSSAVIQSNNPFRLALHLRFINQTQGCSMQTIAADRGRLPPWLREHALGQDPDWFVYERFERDVYFEQHLHIKGRPAVLRYVADYGYLHGSWLGLYKFP